MGLDYLIRLLKELREVIEISGALSEEAQVKLVEKFGKDDLEGITYKLIELQLQLDEVKKANGRSSLYKSKDQRRKSIKEAMLKFIDEQLPWMGEMKEVLHAKENGRARSRK